MSDYEFSESEAIAEPVPAVPAKKKLPAKRKPVPAPRLDSAVESDSSWNKKRKGDLFAIIQGEEKATSRPSSSNSGGAITTASFTSRVSGGQSRRTATINEGQYYVEVKVYNIVDVQNTPPLERYKKALTSVKLRLGDDTRQWETLQEFLISAFKLFKDSQPVKFSDNIHFKP